MGAICPPESGRDCHESHTNTHDPTKKTYLSVDWGLFQINDYTWQRFLIAKGVLDPARPISQQLLDPDMNVRAARVVYLEGPDNVHVELVQHLEAGGH
jgi:hypothetical protein